MTYAALLGHGHYLPQQVLTNHDLEKKIETTHDWITTRTGIHQRHVAAPGEMTSDLAAKAASQALQNAGMTPDQVDMIIVATSTPDLTFPSTAVITQEKLGCRNTAFAFAFDLNAVCSGFVYALSTAESFIKTGKVKTALVIGAEVYSRLLDWDDRKTAVLFGDGAGAFVLGASDRPGILSSRLYSDGGLKDILKTRGGVASTQTAGAIFMEGKEVFKHAVTKMADVVDEVLSACSLTRSDIDWLIPHQANARIITAIGQKLDLPLEKVIMTMDKHANTSAASIPLAFAVAATEGKLKKDDLIVFDALGAGLTWGAVVMRL